MKTKKFHAQDLFRARSTRRRVDRQRPNSDATTMVREQINKPCLFSRLRVNAQGLGLKRSVTTLRGGTLGYAEIVALKVNRPPPPRKARHASWCRDPDGRPPQFPQSPPRCFSPVISSLSNTAVVVVASSLLLFIPPSPTVHSFPPPPVIPPVCQFFLLCPRVVAYIPDARQTGSRRPVANL